MPARSLPNLGLQGFFDLGEDGWKDEMDLNLLKLSVLTQGGAIGKVSADPATPADGDVYIFDETHPTNPNAVAIRDAGAWVYVTPAEGWLIYDRATNTYATFNGTVWAALVTGGGGGGALPAGGTAGQVLTKQSEIDGDADWQDLASGGGGGGAATPMHGDIGSVPPLSAFTQVNMGTLVPVEQAGKAIALPNNGGTGGLRILAKAAPSAPYRVAIAMQRVNESDRMRLCAGFRDPGTGRVTVMLLTNSTLFVQNYNDPTSFSGPISGSDQPLFNGKNIWFGLRNDGTSLIYEISVDGVTFITMATAPLAGNFLANPVQVWAGCNINNVGPETLVIRTWDENGLSRTYS